MKSSPLNYRVLMVVALFISMNLYAQSPQTNQDTERPNIVLILCDDLGYGDLACYGHQQIKSPNLDQMAKEGIRFKHFYSAAPVCSASRVGLLTGRSPNRAGVYDWIPHSSESSSPHMRKNEITFPQLLQKAGYATCLSGKWHCNGALINTNQAQPQDAGFDYWFATQNNAAPSHKNPVNFIRNGVELGPIEGFSCQIVTNEAIKWMEDHVKQNEKQPFFIYLSFHEPHEPIASPKKIVDTYKEIAENTKQAEYFANVENLDKAVGSLMNQLKKLKINDNTLVIFTSDNGPETLNRYEAASRSYGSPGELKGMKLWTSEAGFRVPAIMHWPEKIAAGQISDQVISALDFFPTFCDLAQASNSNSLNLDGSNFTPALHKKKMTRHKPLLWIYYAALNERQVAMRHGDWKISAKLNLPRYHNVTSKNLAKVTAASLSDYQLYNLSKDNSEANDLSNQNPKKLAQMIKLLKIQYQELLEDSHTWK